jgi:sugar/nucleoside kinase (ribokinase family)
MSEMRVVALGAHVLDVLARPVEAIPEGQGGALVEEIRLAPAGAAGGTAVTLAKLGARVTSAGAIGTDTLGDVLQAALESFGVDTSGLVRKAEVQTSATVLPIRPNGDRPALHVLGANVALTAADVPWQRIESADFLHLGAPEIVGPDLSGEILGRARAAGTTTAVDVLADGWPEMLDYLGPIWEYTDWLLPNDDQALAMTGASSLAEAAETIRARGVGGVAVTCGADGSRLFTADGEVAVAAVSVDAVVDTSGCGDAYTAGFLRGLSLGREPAAAAALGHAAASFVAQGLGSDAGEFDLDAALARAGG